MIRRRWLGGGRAELTFELSSQICSGTIFLAGEFNGWDPTDTPLGDMGTVRRVVIELPTGRRYAFRYFADGSWFNDPEADDYEPNEFGGLNGVLDLHGDDEDPVSPGG
jgi:hypothetical protein